MPAIRSTSLLSRFVSSLAVVATSALAVLAVAPTASHAGDIHKIELGRADTSGFLISGAFVGGELAKLMAEVQKVPAGRRIAVLLDSPGGLVAEGLALGRYFHMAKIATFVVAGGQGCHSACSMAFLGGRSAETGESFRVMVSGARVGFHQIAYKFDPAKTYSSNEMAQIVEASQREIGAIDTYLRDVSADPEFLSIMLRTPHTGITLIPDQDASRLGIHLMDQATQKLSAPLGRPAKVAMQ